MQDNGNVLVGSVETPFILTFVEFSKIFFTAARHIFHLINSVFIVAKRTS